MWRGNWRAFVSIYVRVSHTMMAGSGVRRCIIHYKALSDCVLLLQRYGRDRPPPCKSMDTTASIAGLSVIEGRRQLPLHKPKTLWRKCHKAASRIVLNETAVWQPPYLTPGFVRAVIYRIEEVIQFSIGGAVFLFVHDWLKYDDYIYIFMGLIVAIKCVSMDVLI